jgi:hypothetical protein
MTMILPDSTIEVAARALHTDCWKDLPGLGQAFDDLSAQNKDYWCGVARLALTAALPDLIEICAKVADKHLAHVPGHDPDRVGTDRVAQGYGNAALNIAHDIRSLKDRDSNV